MRKKQKVYSHLEKIVILYKNASISHNDEESRMMIYCLIEMEEMLCLNYQQFLAII